MASEKPPHSQGEGLFGGIISLFWNKKASPASGATPATPVDASKGQDYVAWADTVIKKSSELVVMLEDSSIPSSRLVSLMNDVDLILQADHDSTSVCISSFLLYWILTSLSYTVDEFHSNPPTREFRSLYLAHPRPFKASTW